MNFKNLNDSKYSTPSKNGSYQWWSKLLGYIPVIWTGSQWTLINGNVIKSVRWWR